MFNTLSLVSKRYLYLCKIKERFFHKGLSVFCNKYGRHISNIAKKCFGDIKFCTQYIYQKQIEILLNGYKRRYFDSL